MTMLERARDRVMHEACIDEFAAGLATRAVLMAVREPSDSLSAAVRTTEGWEDMIDAILSEGAQ